MTPSEQDPALEPALKDVDSIQSLDTARLGLRWALERMRAFEKHATEIEDALRRSEQRRIQSDAELDAASNLLERRSAEALERERYYSKLEEYLNLKLAGGLDASSMAKREARVEEREGALERKEVEAQRRIDEIKREYDERLRAASEDTVAAAEARIGAAKLEFERRAELERGEITQRLLTAHQKEAHLAALERSLDERRRRFEEFHAAQRAQMQIEAESLGQAASDQAEMLERRIERALAARTAAIEKAAEADRRALLDEVASWRAKAREHLPELLDAQRRAASAEEEAARMTTELARLAAGREALASEVQKWRDRADSLIPARIAADNLAAEAEERFRRAEAELAVATRAAQEYLGELMSSDVAEKAAFQAIERLESVFALKMRDAEKTILRYHDSWVAREESLHRRDVDWRREAEARREAVAALRTDLLSQQEELKRVIAVYRNKTEAATGGPAENRKGDLT